MIIVANKILNCMLDKEKKRELCILYHLFSTGAQINNIKKHSDMLCSFRFIQHLIYDYTITRINAIDESETSSNDSIDSIDSIGDCVCNSNDVDRCSDLALNIMHPKYINVEGNYLDFLCSELEAKFKSPISPSLSISPIKSEISEHSFHSFHSFEDIFTTKTIIWDLLNNILISFDYQLLINVYCRFKQLKTPTSYL